MRKLGLIGSILPVFLVQCTTASRDSTERTWGSPAEAQVMRAEEERHDALLRTDLAVLDRLYADEYIAIHNTGTVRTKSDVLADFSKQRLPYEVRDTRDVIVRVYGDAAVVTGLLIAGLRDGTTRKRRFVNVWVKRDGRWQLVVHQSTPIVTAQ